MSSGILRPVARLSGISHGNRTRDQEKIVATRVTQERDPTKPPARRSASPAEARF